MIIGATLGRGGIHLANHLNDHKQQNDQTLPGPSRGLVSTGIRDGIRELTDLISHARANQPLLHAHANPGKEWNADQWAYYWTLYEKEFSLQNQPFQSAIHIKNGRRHEHRGYSLLRPDGTCLKLPHMKRRHEKLSRLMEIHTGEKIIKGRHNRSVINALEKEGNLEAVAILKQSGIDRGKPAISSLTPQERAQQERTGIPKKELARLVLTAWQDDASAFQHALKSRGVLLAIGDKGPVVIDPTGNVASVARLLSSASKEDGNPMKIRAEAVSRALAPLNLSTYKETKDVWTKEKAGTRSATCQKAAEKTSPASDSGRASEISGAEIIRPDFGGNKGGRGENGWKGNGDIESFDRYARRTDRPAPGTEGHDGADNQKSGRPDQRRQRLIAQAKIKYALTDYDWSAGREFQKTKVLRFDDIRTLNSESWAISRENKDRYWAKLKALRYEQRLGEKHNRAIDADVLLAIIEAILSLFGYSMKTYAVCPVTVEVPRTGPAIDRNTFSLMTESQQDYVLRSAMKKYQGEHRKYLTLCKQAGHPSPLSFRHFLREIQAQGGDWMCESIANLYPREYVKALENSLLPLDHEVRDEMLRMWKDEETRYSDIHKTFGSENLKKDIADHIEVIDADIRQGIAMHEKIEVGLKKARADYREYERNLQISHIGLKAVPGMKAVPALKM